MKPWFRKGCDWHRSVQVDRLRAKLGRHAPLALVVFDSICAWCAEANTSAIEGETVAREVRTWTVNPALGRRLVSALVGVGLLMEDGEGYLIDASIVSRPDAQEERVQGRADRDRQYRQTHAEEIKAKDRARKATRKSDSTSRNDVGRDVESTTRKTGPVVEVSDSTSRNETPSPPLDPPPPPHKHRHEHVHTHEGGSPAAAPAPPGLVGEPSQSNTIAPSRPSPPPAGATAPTEAQEAQEAPITAKPKKAKPARSLPPRKALGEAYAAGISQVTGSPCSPPSERWELDALEAALGTHAPGVVGAEALGWVTSAAKDFAQAKAEDRWTVDRGFPPKMAKAWLDGGNRPPPRPPMPPPPRISPHPGRKVRPAWMDEPDDNTNLFTSEPAAQ